MHAPPLGAQIPQLALQQVWSAGQVVLPHCGPLEPPPPEVGVQAQTWGSEFHSLPWMQSTVAGPMQVQMPPQSAPPFLGSQLSLGSSMHSPAPGHGRPAKPPQCCGLGSGSVGGGHSCLVQPSPGWVQMPQLGLQQVSPAAQVLVPHSTPLPASLPGSPPELPEAPASGGTHAHTLGEESHF